ncbi:MAG TPA: DUF4349 domain-containing protein, partial [Acidimicrobiales bacterium]|nr:DUF4349 domain-containing protein [Acidimicrobiales bacterium]
SERHEPTMSQSAIGTGVPSGSTSAPASPSFGTTKNVGAPEGSNDGQSGEAQPNLTTGIVGQPAKIQESGSADLRVGRNGLQRDVTQLSQLAGALGGFVADTEVQTGGGPGSSPPSASLTLEVPQSSFSALVGQLHTFGTVSSLDTKATDVTSQYVDLQARIAALASSQQQYETIMTKATSIGDILSVQSQLDDIQTQIEQLQGQLQVLDNETTYSSLAVSISEASASPVPGPTPEPALEHAWQEAVHGFLAGIEGLVEISGSLLFVLLLIAGVLLAGRFAWRHARPRAEVRANLGDGG